MSPFLVALLSFIALASAIDSSSCNCGFYDAATEQLYTESIVVYFNETDSIPSNFVAQEFVHKKEKGWTSIYRQGANPDNVAVGNTSQPSWLAGTDNPNSLELFCDPSTDDHLVVGGALESLRQDLFYGSFRASMRSPEPWSGGSALSMMLPFNESESIEIDLLNMKAANLGVVMTIVDDEGFDIDHATNYTTINNGTLGVPATSPWNYMDLRFDWTKDFVNFTINSNMTRSVIAKHSSESIPKVAMPLLFKHWSVGDVDYMQGPPVNRSGANVAWVRAFFNSSVMTTEQHNTFDQRCNPSLACDMDDTTLRGSTTFNATSTLPWKEPAKNAQLVYRSAVVAGIFGFFGVFVLFHAILTRWVPWHWLSYRYWANKSRHGKAEMNEKGTSGPSQNTLIDSEGSSQRSVDYTMKKGFSSTIFSATTTAVNSRAGSASNSRAPSPVRKPGEDGLSNSPYSFGQIKTSGFNDSRDDLSSTAYSPSTTLNSPSTTLNSPSTTLNSPMTPSSKKARLPVLAEGSEKTTFDWDKPVMSEINRSNDELQRMPGGRIKIAEVASRTNSELSLDKGKGVSSSDHPHFHLPNVHAPHIHRSHDDNTVTTTSNFHSRSEALDEKGARRDPVRMTSMIPAAGPNPPVEIKAPQNVRIDYLAGAVAFSCICVTFVHFCLTFMPGVSTWGNNNHSASDYWAKKTIAPYLLTEIWIGPFFTTSSRFLSARYFRNGKLSDIGNKVLLRAPRLLVPIAMIAMAEYFLIEMGLTSALEYLPSVSYTTWPYVSAYSNFGGYINAMFDLSYLIPNAAPAIVSHYCIGVLWTIPVQLQNSYTVLLGAVMVGEIKTHWKRFAFYTFVIANYWYAFNWGALFWAGLMLSDLSVTYKYKEYIQARLWLHYPICITMWLLVIGSCSVFLVSNDFNYDFLTAERDIHPDPQTGLIMGDSPRAGYPNYYEPRLNTLVLATSLQVLVELSVWVQRFLALKPWQWVFPHIMTIYLIHGLIFWTFGAWLCITLSEAGLPYWANMLVTVVLCYTLLAIVVKIVTPLTDKTAKNACKNLWRWAQEEPVPKRPTLGSYGKDLILNRAGASEKEAAEATA